MPCTDSCYNAAMLRLWLLDSLLKSMQCHLQLRMFTMLTDQQVHRQRELGRTLNTNQLATSQPGRYYLTAEVAAATLLQQHL